MNLREKLALLHKNECERTQVYHTVNMSNKRISELTEEIEIPILAERDLDHKSTMMKIMIDDDGVQLRPGNDGIFCLSFKEAKALNKILNELYAEGK